MANNNLYIVYINIISGDEDTNYFAGFYKNLSDINAKDITIKLYDYIYEEYYYHDDDKCEIIYEKNTEVNIIKIKENDVAKLFIKDDVYEIANYKLNDKNEIVFTDNVLNFMNTFKNTFKNTKEDNENSDFILMVNCRFNSKHRFTFSENEDENDILDTDSIYDEDEYGDEYTGNNDNIDIVYIGTYKNLNINIYDIIDKLNDYTYKYPECHLKIIKKKIIKNM
jgi:hypothetical protein